MTTTTLQQSVELLEAGLNPDTADFVHERNYEMVYDVDEGCYVAQERDGYKARPRRDIDRFGFDNDIVPAWSIGKLWEIVSRLTRFAFTDRDSPQNVISTLVCYYKLYR